MKVKFLDLVSQNKITKDLFLKEVSDIVDSASFVAGKRTSEFEEKFAEYCGAKYCVAVSNGTTALHAALLGLELKGKVLTAPNSFIATSEAISHCHDLVHDFVDANSSGGMDCERSSQRVSSETTLILPTSLYGNPCDVEGYCSLSERSGVPFVNDAAQAHGSLVSGKKIGEFGAATCFSFYPGKNLGTCGEGGAIVTNDKSLYERIKVLINHGQKAKYEHEIVGYNYRISEIQAAMLSIKLKFIDEWNDRRIEVARRYRNNLSNANGIGLLDVPDKNKCVYHIFPVFIKDRLKVKGLLHEEGIETGIHYPTPIHLQNAYKHLHHKRGDFPEAERQADMELSLPMFPELTNDEIDYVSEKLISHV